MGQQQLILLVLATVIVGVAIVIGVRAFTENNVKNNYDALVHDAMRMASDANAWKQKPESFGGQATGDKAAGVWTDGTGALTFDDIGWTTTAAATCVLNENGAFTVDATAGTITGVNPSTANEVVVTLPTGTDLAPELNAAASSRGNAPTANTAIPTGCAEAVFGGT